MRKKTSEQQSSIKKAEAFVRDALSKSSKKPPSARTVRMVAKKVAKAIPQLEVHA